MRMGNQSDSGSGWQSAPYQPMYRPPFLRGVNPNFNRGMGAWIVCWNFQREGHIATYCPFSCAREDYVPLCRLCTEEGHEETYFP